MGRYYKKFNARIGVVCDAILFDSLAPAADFVYLPPTDEWRERISSIDLLLVASTWRGLENDGWDGLGRVGEPIRDRLLEIIDACNGRGIPTVFYSKEDPPNYNVFLANTYSPPLSRWCHGTRRIADTTVWTCLSSA